MTVGGILDRYIARSVIAGTAISLLVILSLSLIFEFVDESGDVGQGGYTMLLAMVHVLLSTPYRAYEAFPVATLIGALVALGQLAGRSELVVMRASGWSVGQIARSVITAGVLLALVSAVLGEYVAPRAERLAEQVRARALAGDVGGLVDGSFWVRDGNRYVRVGRAPAATRIEDVTLYELDGNRITQRITAREGRFRGEGRWRLIGVEVVRFGERRIERESLDTYMLEGELSPQTLELVVVEPETLAATRLLDYIDYRARNGLDASRYRLAFWIKVATPVATITMLLLALPLVFGSLRRTGAGQQIFIGVLIGVAFFLANRLLANLGIVYGLPPLLSAFAPTMVFLALALFGLTRVR